MYMYLHINRLLHFANICVITLEHRPWTRCIKVHRPGICPEMSIFCRCPEII